MENLPTQTVNVSNVATTDAAMSNTSLTARINDALWLSATLPWQLDEPWAYENDIAYNTLVTNQTI